MRAAVVYFCAVLTAVHATALSRESTAHGGLALLAQTESCTRLTSCATCVSGSGSSTLRGGYNCYWDSDDNQCHSKKKSRTNPKWLTTSEQCAAAALFDSVLAMTAQYSQYACMDAQRFATCINPKVKDAVLQREKAANAEPAPAAFRGHFPPQIATRGFVQTKKTESMNMKLKTASKDGDFSGIPAALAQTATQLDGVKAGVCTSFAYIMFEKLKTDLAASLTRLEIVDNGATDLGTHLFVVVNRQGADVAVGGKLPAPTTWGFGFIADAWEASLGYPAATKNSALGPNHGRTTGQRVLYAKKFP